MASPIHQIRNATKMKHLANVLWRVAQAERRKTIAAGSGTTIIDSKQQEADVLKPETKEEIVQDDAPNVEERITGVAYLSQSQDTTMRTTSHTKEDDTVKFTGEIKFTPAEDVRSFHKNSRFDNQLQKSKSWTEWATDLGSELKMAVAFKTSLWGDTNVKQVVVEQKVVPEKKAMERAVVSESAINNRTRELIHLVTLSRSGSSTIMRLTDLCNHLSQYPATKSIAIKERALPLLLLTLQRNSEKVIRSVSASSTVITGLCRQALILLGHVEPPQSRGYRILSMDGGGMRGLVGIQVLRALEEVTGQPVYRLFDFMCGVSTGAVIVLMLGPLKMRIDEVESLYKQFGTEVFGAQSAWSGMGNLFWSHSYYDSKHFETLLQRSLGEIPLIETIRDPDCPKICIPSAIVNSSRLRAYAFRNYDFPPRVQSFYMGGHTAALWEAARASGAAPGYFSEFKLGGYVHQDGGVMLNNPTSLALHEANHLWPREKIQCVVSIGTGRQEVNDTLPTDDNYTSLKTKVAKIVDSATDVEGVHTILHDLLPPSRYYRFNPFLTDYMNMDDGRPERLAQLQQDTKMYLRRNRPKVEKAAEMLSRPRMETQKIVDEYRTIKAKYF